MIKTTVNIEGMMCGMCEKHVNEAIVNTMILFSRENNWMVEILPFVRKRKRV